MSDNASKPEFNPAELKNLMDRYGRAASYLGELTSERAERNKAHKATMADLTAEITAQEAVLAELRAAIEPLALESGEKRPHPAIEIENHVAYEYDPLALLQWAIATHRHSLLQINETALRLMLTAAHNKTEEGDPYPAMWIAGDDMPVVARKALKVTISEKTLARMAAPDEQPA